VCKELWQRKHSLAVLKARPFAIDGQFASFQAFSLFFKLLF